jgi:hypothetical protein
MNVVVFLGPTLSAAEAKAVLPATYLPPVSRGDLYAAAREQPWAIGIIDGYFHRVPSVLHKEILWAMSRGIHVYGASSMGALRAAELVQFGMVGVGRVFEWYRDGILTDDDEVAISHGPVQVGYIAASDALVNIRETMGRALDAGVVGPQVHNGLLRIAKGMFYPTRTYADILQAGIEDGLSAEECRNLSAWLPHGKGDVKREDAISLLRRLAADRSASFPPLSVSYGFNSTGMWEELCSSVERRSLEAFPEGVDVLGHEVLDELRLRGDDYVHERERAMTRLLATELGLHQRTMMDSSAEEAVSAEIRKSNELNDDHTFDLWLRRESLTTQMFSKLVKDEAVIRRICDRYRSWVPAVLHDSLRIGSRYGNLEARAKEKQVTLSRWGLQSPALSDAGLSEEELWRWFFEDHLKMPKPMSPQAFADRNDFADLDLLRRAVLREFLYLRKLAVSEHGANIASGAIDTKAH